MGWMDQIASILSPFDYGQHPGSQWGDFTQSSVVNPSRSPFDYGSPAAVQNVADAPQSHAPSDPWGLSPFDYEDAKADGNQAFGLAMVKGAFSHNYADMGMALNLAHAARKKVQDDSLRESEKRAEDRQKFLSDQEQEKLTTAYKTLQLKDIERSQGKETAADAAYTDFLSNSKAFDTVISKYEEQMAHESDPTRAEAMAAKLASSKALLGMYAKVGGKEGAMKTSEIIDNLNTELRVPYDRSQLFEKDMMESAIRNGESSFGDLVTKKNDQEKRDAALKEQQLATAKAREDALRAAMGHPKGVKTLGPMDIKRIQDDEYKRLNEPLKAFDKNPSYSAAKALGFGDDQEKWKSEVDAMRAKIAIQAEASAKARIAELSRTGIPAGSLADDLLKRKGEPVVERDGLVLDPKDKAFQMEMMEAMSDPRLKSHTPQEIEAFKAHVIEQLKKKYGI